MSICASCSTNNPAGTEFCEVCGAPLGTAPRGRTELGAPPDAARKSRTLYDPGPSRPEPAPTDAFTNAGSTRSRFDPQDPFKSSIVSRSPRVEPPAAPPQPPARGLSDAPTPARSLRHKTVLHAPVADTSALRGVLCIYEGESVRLVPLVYGRTALGRDEDSDVALDDPNISGSHAFIYVKDEGCTFIDVSRNGSVVDGRPLMGESATLRHGSVLQLGEIRLQLLTVPPAPRGESA